VHSYGQELLENKNYEKYLTKARTAGMKQQLTQATGISVVSAVIFFFFAYCFSMGRIMVLDDTKFKNNDGKPYTGGDVAACMFGIFMGATTLGASLPQLRSIVEGKVSGYTVYQTINRIPEILVDDKSKPKVDKEKLKGRIVFQNVNFTYPTRPEQPVLRNFSAVFQAGKTTAIVGPSGSGKSTIIQLIERFYDPESGQVMLDGHDILQLNLKSLRQTIGYVSQEPVLFNTSIKENLKFGMADATDAQIIEALKNANAYDFIEKKMGEKGINTIVGSSGGQLSGGQKQRIAIARAFIKKPKILLLDEATSALDKKNEKIVQHAIDKIRKQLGDVTTIVIAHRLSTIKESDNILVMQYGELKEEGNHDELL
jgi:ATP-binding cassette subfamily B (MDR/TAP) protein 1